MEDKQTQRIERDVLSFGTWVRDWYRKFITWGIGTENEITEYRVVDIDPTEHMLFIYNLLQSQRKEYERIIEEVIGEDDYQLISGMKFATEHTGMRNKLRDEQRQRAKDLLSRLETI